MRDIKDVIDQIVEHVPKNNELLLQVLGHIKSDAKFVAPEDNYMWFRAHSILISNMNDIPQEDWEFEVWAIFSDQPVEKVKEQVKKYINS
jgi:hypothetical protein